MALSASYLQFYFGKIKDKNRRSVYAINLAQMDYNKEFQTISNITITARKRELTIIVTSVHNVLRGVFVTDFLNTAWWYYYPIASTKGQN